MKSIFDLLSRRTRKSKIETEVDDELNFHIDMQTGDYLREGLSREKSRQLAETRFGDVERIRKECVAIGSGRSFAIWMISIVFLICLMSGLMLRMLISEQHVNRVGDVMMMIGGLGILLVYAKQAGARVFNSDANTLKLGLRANTPPVSFDEKGRSPFERVRADD